MKIVIFGLSISSSWGNGHATLWRGLCRALIERGHRVVFFERDLSFYAAHRDLNALAGGELILYRNWPEVIESVRRQLADADVGMITSYCPDALLAADELFWSRACRVFYDLDTPVTLSRLSAGEPVGYIGERGLGDFDLVLSYTGGAALSALQTQLGARCVAPLYGSVDPSEHHPVSVAREDRAALSYLGTFAADRQAALEQLFIVPARQRPQLRFKIGGAQYPPEFPWTENIFFVRHLPPSEHSAFYCSSRITLNVTRGAMADMGFCPSGRVFEAAACGVPILSDSWVGLDTFFQPEEEILVARNSEQALAALDLSDEQLARIASQARERVFAEHTSARRAAELEVLLENAGQLEPSNMEV